MHWPIIRLIWRRELLDLFRDRRTVLMIFLLPLVLYPLLGFIGFGFALGSVQQVSVVGIVGIDHLPPATPASMSAAVLPAPWLAVTPGTGVAGFTSAFAAMDASRDVLAFPPLVVNGKFLPDYYDFDIEAKSIRIVALAASNHEPLDSRQVDVMLIVPPNLQKQLRDEGRARLDVYYREGDERSRQADRRLRGILSRWRRQVTLVRFFRQGLPPDFDNPIEVRRPQQEGQSELKFLTDEFTDVMSKFFPFLLIMWALAGALHPAIDLTAGEKERATLETLLLSPASRGEIVCGKFLAVWLFSAMTALWNLAWLGGGAWLASLFLPVPILRLAGLFWCAVITLFLAALFSAVSMALGAYARSTKEGQYYLLPLFVITMPLTFLPLLPGVELNWMYAWVPITGATLLLQKLMQPTIEPGIWIYFLPVLGSLIVCNALSLRWAVAQFCREEVLFRESEGIDWQGWVRRLLPHK